MDIKPNAFQKFIHLFIMLKPVTYFFARTVPYADSALFKLTGGRHAFADLVGLPIVQLATRGAKTGKIRVVPIVGLFAGERVALIGTNFGRRKNPAWYYNLKAQPVCEVTIRGRKQSFKAREVSGQEYETYWQLALSYYTGYQKYKERASHRQIPVLLLEPLK